MKNLKLFVVVMVFLTLSKSYCFSQSSETSGGVDLSFLRGTTAFGFSARYEVPFKSSVKWMATGGLGFGSGITLLSLQGGAKYNFEGSDVYAGLEIGPLFLFGNGNSESRFTFTPQVGYRFDKFDVSLRYYVGNGVDFANLRFAYIF